MTSVIALEILRHDEVIEVRAYFQTIQHHQLCKANTGQLFRQK